MFSFMNLRLLPVAKASPKSILHSMVNQICQPILWKNMPYSPLSLVFDDTSLTERL